MKAPGKLAKALIFITVCVALLAVFFVSVAGDRLLRSWETYYVEFENQSVDGLEVGGNVQYRGISVGNVREIEFSRDNPDLILVEIAVEEDVPVRSDVRASVAPVGISGISQLQLTGGSRDAPFLEPGDRLRAETSLMSTLTGSAESVAGGVEELLEAMIDMLGQENREEISALLRSLRGTIDDLRPGLTTIVGNFEQASHRVVESMDEIEEATRSFQAIAGNLERGTGELRIGETMEEVEAAARSLRTITGNLERGTGELRIGETMEEVEAAARSLRTITGNLERSTGELRIGETMEEVEAAARSLRVTAGNLERGTGELRIGETMEEVEAAARSLRTSIGNLERSTGELRLAESAEALNRAVSNVDSVVGRAGTTVDEIELIVQENRHALASSLRSFQRAMRSLSEVASQIDSDPSLLLRGRTGGSTVR